MLMTSWLTADGFQTRTIMPYPFWSSAGRSFVMRSLNPCPENFDQIVVIFGGGGKLPNANCDQTTKWKYPKLPT